MPRTQLCDHVARAKRWREFAAAHDGRLPAQGAADPRRRAWQGEGHWSSRDKQPHQAVYLILLRDVIGFASECTGRRGDGASQKEVQTRVKRLLQGGYGLREGVVAASASHCPECGNTDKAYAFLSNYVNGGSPDNGIAANHVDSVFTQARFDAFKKLLKPIVRNSRNAESDAKRRPSVGNRRCRPIRLDRADASELDFGKQTQGCRHWYTFFTHNGRSWGSKGADSCSACFARSDHRNALYGQQAVHLQHCPWAAWPR